MSTPLGNGTYCLPLGEPLGGFNHPLGFALGIIKKPLGGTLGMIKSPTGVHKTPYPTGGGDMIFYYFYETIWIMPVAM